MKISEVISIAQISGAPFIPKPAGCRNGDMLPIYPTHEGVCYWNEETIWSISQDNNCKKLVSKIKMFITKHFPRVYDDNRKFNKYLAVCELLIVIDIYNGREVSINIKNAIKYVDRLNKEIESSLDFKEISCMDNLKNSIKEDKLYKELSFNVREIKSTKEREFCGYTKEKRQYHFGNIKYHEELDVVDIELYDDCVELKHQKNCYKYGRKLDIGKEYSTEEKIYLALDCWRGDERLI